MRSAHAHTFIIIISIGVGRRSAHIRGGSVAATWPFLPVEPTCLFPLIKTPAKPPVTVSQPFAYVAERLRCGFNDALLSPRRYVIR